MSVAIGHWGPLYGVVLINAQIAVLLFFIISGFYMSLIINERYRLLKNWRRKFILNRALRIYPAYFVVLALMIVHFTVNNVENPFTIPDPDIGPALNTLFAVLNITLVGEDVISGLMPLYDSVQRSLVPQSWTLGTEFLFYFLAPFLIFSTPRKYRAIVAGVALASLSLRLSIFHYPNEIFGFLNGRIGIGEDIARRLVASDPGRYRIFPTTLVMFLMGYFSYLIYLKVQGRRWAVPFGKILFAGLIAACGYYIIVFGKLDSPLYVLDKDSLPVWALYIFALFAMPFIFLATKYNRFDAFLGSLSFPIYISHIFIKAVLEGQWARFFDAPRPPEPVFMGIVLVSTIVFSILLVQLIEKPIDGFRRRISER